MSPGPMNSNVWATSISPKPVPSRTYRYQELYSNKKIMLLQKIGSPAGRRPFRAEFDAFPTRMRSNSGPEARFWARRQY